MPSTETIISFLVSRRFGATAILASALANFDKTQNIENSKIIAKIEEYKNSLRDFKSNELLSIYNEELIKQEKERFYNQAYANADFVHWAKAAHWSIDEAITLSFGKEPDVVTWKKIESIKNDTAFAKQFAKRRDLALRARSAGRFNDSILPVTFISWAREVKIELPNTLIEEVTKVSGATVDWHDEYLAIKIKYDELLSKPESKQKLEPTRKTENLLRALACIAIDEYGYVPESEKSTAPKEISDALNRQGKSVDPKTIRGWLKEGVELLPSKPHKN